MTQECCSDGYLHLALRGSFPKLALDQLSEAQRRLWPGSYLDDLVRRDAAAIGRPRDPVRLRRDVSALALNLAGRPAEASLTREAGINARTAAAYDRALTNLAVLDIVPAWTSNRLNRLTRIGKRYLVDTALAASSPRRALHHLRVEGRRREVDLVVDLGRGRVFGIECKAGSAPTCDDARHLIGLREELGKNFAGRVVLHSAQAVIELDHRIVALPLSALWTVQSDPGPRERWQ